MDSRTDGGHPWDYFIGSVITSSDSWAIDDPQKLSEWNHREPRKVWSALLFFRPADESGGNRLFEIIAHADLRKRSGHRPAGDAAPRLRICFLMRGEKKRGCGH